jgi:hypothetical protein
MGYVQEKPQSKLKPVLFTSLIMFVVFYFGGRAFAAPHPATASSKLISPHIGLYISSRGYTINASQTDWIQSEAPTSSPFIEIMYRPKNESESAQAALTVRVDQIEDSSLDLTQYMKKWIKDYPRYGFDVLSARPIMVKAEHAYMVDLMNPQTGKQLRQVIFMKNAKTAILTCRDERQKFLNTLKACNQIIRNFQWTAFK